MRFAAGSAGGVMKVGKAGFWLAVTPWITYPATILISMCGIADSG